MKLMITYTKNRQSDKLVLLGAYTEGFSMEKRFDFAPKARMNSLEEHRAFLETSPFSLASVFFSDIATDLDEESFVKLFSEKLKVSLSEYGDERVIAALSMGGD